MKNTFSPEKIPEKNPGFPPISDPPITPRRAARLDPLCALHCLVVVRRSTPVGGREDSDACDGG